MHFESAEQPPSLRDGVLIERRATALNRFDDRVPALYRPRIELPAEVSDWIAGGGSASLLLTGPIGIGKTHAAWQTCRRWLEAQYGPGEPWQGTPVIQTWRSTALFDALRPDAGDGEGRALVRSLQRCDLLFIDDLAAARASTWTQERLFELFDERYINRRPVIVTCDVLPNHLSEVTGPRVASRIAEMCRNSIVLLEGSDRRMEEAA